MNARDLDGRYMLPEDAGDSSQGRTPADNATVRSVFVIGPDMVTISPDGKTLFVVSRDEDKL